MKRPGLRIGASLFFLTALLSWCPIVECAEADMIRWADYDAEFVRRRFNRVAAIYPIFDVLLWLPPGACAEAVRRLELVPGARVLEVGCGTGRNLARLVQAVGPSGHVYGADLSEGMLARAKKRCARHGWPNVTLLHSDASAYTLPESVEGVLFSLSYSVIPHHREALRRAWSYLRPGGHVVILDGKLMPGAAGKFFRPLVLLTMKATVLGNPDKRPWEDLREFTDRVQVTEIALGTYFICRGTRMK